MKINSITTNHYIKGKAIEHSPMQLRECAQRENNKEINNDQINTTIKNNNFDGRVNFKGAEQAVEKLKEPLLHKVANFTQASPLLAEALFALVITCGLRPVTIMATAKTDEEKAKCKYQAVKSISSGVVGLGFTAFVGSWIKNAKGAIYASKGFKQTPEGKQATKDTVKTAFDTLKGLAEGMQESTSPYAQQTRELIKDSDMHLNLGSFKWYGHKGAGLFKQRNYLKELKSRVNTDMYNKIKEGFKAQHILDKYPEIKQSLTEKILQPISMPVRAAITIALIPVILTGMKKIEEVIAEKKKQKEMLNNQGNNQDFNYNNLMNNKEINIFGDFLKGGSNESK